MSDAAQERALSGLRDLKEDFRGGARIYQRPGLYHVLVQLEYDSRETPGRLEPHPKSQQLPPGSEALGAGPRLLAAHLPEPYPVFRHYYFGELKALGKFVELASAAASCVRTLASRHARTSLDAAQGGVLMDWHYEDLLPAFDALGGEHDHDLWPLVVHELAWRRIDGSPLLGQRQIWGEAQDPNYGPYEVVAPYEADRFRRFVGSYHGGPPACWSGVEPPFDHFFSALPCDIYRGSMYAIDLITELTVGRPQAKVGADRSIGMSASRDGEKTQGLVPDDEATEGWIVGSRRELNLALDVSETYSDYLERQVRLKVLELRKLDNRRLAIRLFDPARHERVKVRMERRRG